MKIKKVLLTVAATATLFAFGLESSNANASNVKSLKSYPKNVRGTWYAYSFGKMHKVKYYKNKTISYYDGHKSTSYVHKYKNHDTLNISEAYKKKTSNWVFLTKTSKVHGYHWIKIYGWNQGAGAGGFITYNKFDGHEVLSDAGNAGIQVYNQYYRTPELAKQLANKKYPNFQYVQ